MQNRQLHFRDEKVLELLMNKNEQEMIKYLDRFMKKYYKEKYLATNDYIIAFGDLPVCLVAHCDTVFDETKPYEMIYDREKNIIASLFRGGFDDKAGVFMIMKLIEEGFRPNILFTTGEERGGTGVSKFVKDFPECPWPDIKYFIQIDRRGNKDLVTYDCENDEFDKYIEKTSHYFTKSYGSFTDICTLMPAYGIAGCNLSTGYYNEHTRDEFLDVSEWFQIFEAIKKLLKQARKIKKPFEYIEEYSYYGNFNYIDNSVYSYENQDYCDGCYGMKDIQELTPVVGTDGATVFFCKNCLEKYAKVCPKCGRWFDTEGYSFLTECSKCKDFDEEGFEFKYVGNRYKY